MARSRLLRDFTLQAGGKYTATALQTVRGIVLAALLGPLGMGTLATVMVVLGYGMYSDLGVGESAMRELPLAIGARDAVGQAGWRWYAISGKVVGALCMAAGLLAYVLVAWSHLAPDLRFGLCTAVVVLVLQQFVAGHVVVFQAAHQFGRVTVLNIGVPAVSLVAGLLGAWVAGVRGVFVGQILAYACASAVAVLLGGLPRRRPLPGMTLLRLILIGLPFVALGFANYNLIYVDQVMVVTLLGRAPLGIYTLTLYAGSALYLLPTALALSIGPRLLRRYGEEPSAAVISDYTWRPVHLLSVALPPAVAAVWLFGPWLVQAVLPKYVATIAPMRIYAFGIFFLGLNIGVSTTLYAFNRYRRNIPVLVAAIALNVVLDLLFVPVLGLGLPGIALGSAVTYFAYWVGQTTLVTQAFGLSAVGGARRLAGYGWPGVLLAVALLLFRSSGDLGTASPALAAGVLVFFCVLSGVRLVREGVLDDVRRVLGRGAE